MRQLLTATRERNLVSPADPYLLLVVLHRDHEGELDSSPQRQSEHQVWVTPLTYGAPVKPKGRRGWPFEFDLVTVRPGSGRNLSGG